ncbi:class 1 fructose-bisphosphatase [Rufibacter sediminis]|uniref:Fructose-1,6-bisphosphatase class 1 n=1 Tax=Rufibacter sediminis TaxID=2762756 RepID=A0ABR6VW93_9BACT|nr:class 1 fructose-bisphosphatase [Rufibacter sediminis]MBC3541162.1 class 1 fructose-bisphosphatase [Rufibacter sediminis]
MNDALALPVGTTLDRFIMRKQEEFPYATGELSQLLRDMALAAKIVSREISRADQATMGSFGQQNVQGEEQQKLDLIANIRFVRALRNGGEVCAIVSEEEEDIIHTGNTNAKYIVAMDPLDGSSNIDVNIPVGTIFSIYRRLSEGGQNGTLEDCLQKGTQQAAAGYILYGASTMLVYTTGHGVNGFTYEPSLGEFFLSHPNMKIPSHGKQYSCNDANVSNFPLGIQNYLAFCREQKYSSRYIGSLVADFHRNLLKGGIYFYPASAKNKTGKLRLLYECNPLAFIAEQAGGQATDGIERILDKTPTALHERCPLVIGSSEMIEKVKKYMTL